MKGNREDVVTILEELVEKIQCQIHSVEDTKKIYSLRKRLDDALITLFEYHLRHNEDASDLRWMYKELKKESVSSTLQAIAYLGYKLRNKLGKDFKKMGYRILEQIRAGKRNEVEYSIVRIFVANGETLPNELVEAFKPRYEDDVFRAFMYVFIGSVIEEDKKGGEQ